jgi:hypothetical protein
MKRGKLKGVYNKDQEDEDGEDKVTRSPANNWR